MCMGSRACCLSCHRGIGRVKENGRSGVEGGRRGVGLFLQGLSSFYRTMWHAFPENHFDATLHLTNLILFLSSS